MKPTMGLPQERSTFGTIRAAIEVDRVCDDDRRGFNDGRVYEWLVRDGKRGMRTAGGRLVACGFAETPKQNGDRVVVHGACNGNVCSYGSCNVVRRVPERVAGHKFFPHHK